MYIHPQNYALRFYCTLYIHPQNYALRTRHSVQVAEHAYRLYGGATGRWTVLVEKTRVYIVDIESVRWAPSFSAPQETVWISVYGVTDSMIVVMEQMR